MLPREVVPDQCQARLPLPVLTKVPARAALTESTMGLIGKTHHSLWRYAVTLAILAMCMWTPSSIYGWRWRSDLHRPAHEWRERISPAIRSVAESFWVDQLLHGGLDAASYRERMEQIAAAENERHPLEAPER